MRHRMCRPEVLAAELKKQSLFWIYMPSFVAFGFDSFKHLEELSYKSDPFPPGACM